MQIRKRQLAGLAAILIATGGLLTVRRPAERSSVLLGKTAKVPPRKIYPYSVIRGGVVSAFELRQALLTDRIAALHYADFQTDRARVEPLDRPRKVFVSYRIGDRIYWTQKRVVIPQGEQVLSDGTSITRARCGNRISDSPQLPVNPANEPSEKVLDHAMTSSQEASSSEESVSEPESARAMGKVEGGANPTGDYLSSFGPKAVTSMGERAFGGGQMSSMGTSGGLFGSGGASLPGPGSSGSREESTSNSQSSLNTVSGGMANPGSAISAQMVLTPQGPLTYPSSGTTHLPVSVQPDRSVLHSAAQLIPTTAEGTEWNFDTVSTQGNSPVSDALSVVTSSDRPEHTSVLRPITHSQASIAGISRQPLINEVQTPEPKPLLLVLCGAALVFSGFLIRRRARVP